MHLHFFKQYLRQAHLLTYHCSHGNFEIMLVSLLHFKSLHQNAGTGHAGESHTETSQAQVMFGPF